MRILFTIPHFFKHQDTGLYGSLIMEPEERCRSLTSCLTALRSLYGHSQAILHVNERAALPANQDDTHHVDIVVCTVKNFHLLSNIGLPSSFLAHHCTDINPLLLGFECQKVLKSYLGQYDYYCYLEDDLILHDPWLFLKLKWFNDCVGNDSLLQPNRYEMSPSGTIKKIYVDGYLRLEATSQFQNIQNSQTIQTNIMGREMIFQRTTNPHSGCYFLNANQMEEWSRKPYFLDGDTSFIGPLESAATLGIMKTFKVYKPTAANATFLEIQHFGDLFIRKIVD